MNHETSMTGRVSAAALEVCFLPQGRYFFAKEVRA